MAVFACSLFLELLRHAGCSLGEPFHYLQQTNSTNDDARKAAANGAPHGSTFLAEAQLAGRGRRGRSWHSSESESLTFSLVLRPALPPERLSAVTLAIGLGVREALAAEVSATLQIKWPNDVVCAGRKIAGVLVEGHGFTDPPVLVAGIGINVGGAAFPAEIAETATSLVLLGAEVPRERLLVAVLRGVERWLDELQRGRLGQLTEELSRWDALLGCTVRVDGKSGIARGIDASGQLLLEAEDEVCAIRSGTVERL